MQKKSGQVALGGIATGMCIALMFATGMIPFSYYALPALAGLVLIAVREENGLSTALIVFAAVSLLSVFVVPIKEAALLFIAFFWVLSHFAGDLCQDPPQGAELGGAAGDF